MQRDPSFVDKILDWPLTWPLARIGLTSAYLLGGVTKLINFSAALAEQEQYGLHPSWLWASMTAAVEIIAPILIISGRFVWLGAGVLGVFTGLAAILANDFWRLEGQARFSAMNTFFEHVGLIAAFIMAALIAELMAKQRGRSDTSWSEE